MKNTDLKGKEEKLCLGKEKHENYLMLMFLI